MTLKDIYLIVITVLAVGGTVTWVVTTFVLSYRRLAGYSSTRVTRIVTASSFVFVVVFAAVCSFGQPVCIGLSFIPAALVAYVTYTTIESPRITKELSKSLAQRIQKRFPPRS